jgi:hypothetical protein
MRTKKEIRVYVINNHDTEFLFRVAEDQKRFNDIKDEAERLGSVYSLNGFQEAMNNQDIELGNSFILID